MILHIDIDCFFVSAHRIENESLRRKAVAVGGRSNLTIFEDNSSVKKISENSGSFMSSIVSSNEITYKDYFIDPNGRIRGIITTASYEARRYGIKTAMNVREALSLCPHLIMVPPNYELYHRLSKELSDFLYTKTPLVEQFSIDEFFIDIKSLVDEKSIKSYCENLKDEIAQKIKLPVSIGASKTKWIAKLATEDAKPNGVKVVFYEEVEDYIKDIDIDKFPGIGKGFKTRLLSNGIRKLGDVKYKKKLFLEWKKPGIQLYNRIMAEDNEKITKKDNRKSIGMARTFDPIACRDEIKRRIIIFIRYLSFLVYKQKVNPQTIYLRLKYEYTSKSKGYISFNREFSETILKEKVLELFKKLDTHPKQNIVQINIILSNFIENQQGSYNIFEFESDKKKSLLSNKINFLRDKYGVDIIKSAIEIKSK